MVVYESRCTPPCEHQIFINFRTGDEGFAPDIVYQALANEFGAKKVFYSGKSIPIGVRFPDELSVHAQRCTVMLSLIGHNWLTIAGEDGRPKIADPKDWVRREIATALAAERDVIPVLLDDTPRLSAGKLPRNIAKLAETEACKLRPRGDTERDFLLLKQRLAELIPSLGGSGAAGPGSAAFVAKVDVEVGEVSPGGRVWGVHNESLDGRTAAEPGGVRIKIDKLAGEARAWHHEIVPPPSRDESI